MAENKSILEAALLDIQNVQKALNANTKEILRSVAKEEIESVVKESLTKEVYEEEDLDPADDSVDLGADADAATADVNPELAGGGEDSVEGMPSDIEGSEVAPAMGPEVGMNAPALGGDEMDMTAASDDDVIAIYKKLSGEDEIEIVGDEIHLNISEPGEYVIKANDGTVGGGEEAGAPADLAPVGDDDDVEYDIEVGDDEAGAEEAPADLEPVSDEEGTEGEEAGEESEGDEEGEEEKEELEEAIPVGSAQAHRLPGKAQIGQPKGAGADNLKEAELAKAKKLVSETEKKYTNLLAETTKLKNENEQFKTALADFRKKLMETVVYNTNLSYVTRLFTEHSTTKAEKMDIMKRFDSQVSTVKESKKLYTIIASELKNRKPIAESVENKIIKEATSSVSKQLNESTAYVDPSTKRIIDLMKRVENKNN